MSISNNGYHFINNYINFFKFFNKDEELDKTIVKKLYLDAKDSDVFAKSFTKTINKESIIITKENEQVIEELNLNTFTQFTSTHIIKAMKQIKKVLKYNFIINNIEYQLVFLLLKNSDERIIDKKLKLFVRNIHFLIKYTTSNMKTLKIIILFSEEKKEKNKDKSILNANNVNTGVTRSCAIDGRIFLYRQEELIKVLIHELIHSKCIDFSNININASIFDMIKEMFNINSSFIISESYSEFWANIINTIFVAIDATGTTGTNLFDLFYENFTLLHIIEKIFSLHQIVSILDYMDLTYKDIITGKKVRKYTEDTNVFAYYILKTIWLYFGNDYLSFMKYKNTKNLLNSNNNLRYIKEIVEKTKKYYKNNKFLSIINNMENKFLSLKNSENNEIINSLRMTILEQK